ncbi:hypothetical protein IAR50_004168 [Cryptococcus sp. DSM 104548]
MTSNTNYTTGTVDNSAGSQAASGLGDKIKGSWNVFHGTGEGIRGNVNSFLDNAGEQIQGNNTAAATQQPSHKGERPAGVASKGADEIQKGVEQIRR